MLLLFAATYYYCYICSVTYQCNCDFMIIIFGLLVGIPCCIFRHTWQTAESREQAFFHDDFPTIGWHTNQLIKIALFYTIFLLFVPGSQKQIVERDELFIPMGHPGRVSTADSLPSV